ncbi:hypothetical protein BCEP27_80103 [Burkholderia cepacia]
MPPPAAAPEISQNQGVGRVATGPAGPSPRAGAKNHARQVVIRFSAATVFLRHLVAIRQLPRRHT